MLDLNKKIMILTLGLLFFFAGCKKEEKPTFEINNIELYPSSASKDKLKTNEQYVAILHANLFQTALSANEIFQINNLMESIGDKELAREVIISNFMNDEGVNLPSVEEMQGDVDQFIEDTYLRFYVRFPTEAEKKWMKGYIESNTYVTPELVFFSFALSNEYMFY